jgi:hypothetical protein
MKLFIIGSLVDNDVATNEFSSFCSGLGSRFALKAVDLILCSPYPGSADIEIIKGVSTQEPKALTIELHFPRTLENETSWDRLIESLNASVKITKFRHEAPIISESEAVKYGWLFCQIQAINNCDFVVVIGGKVSGSSNLLVRVADVQGKEIIPLPKFGGVGELYFERKRYQLIDQWGLDSVDAFSSCEDLEKIVDTIIDQRKDERFEQLKLKKQDFTFFISYPKERPAEADFIEMVLRRRNHNVFRDDNDFSPGEDISNAIKENIFRSDVFIGLWCKEYACSPWCFDELSLALDMHEREGKVLWIFKLDETRMVHPKARNILWYNTNSRAEIEGRILHLLKVL